MNITEALDAGLHCLPERAPLQSFPRLHPDLIVRQHNENGAPVVVAHIPGTTELFRFLPDHWALLQLFDGRRSYAEVCNEFRRQSGNAVSESDLRTFVQMLQDNGFWYQTGRDAYLSYAHRGSERINRKTRRFADFARIDLAAWDPDMFLTRFHRYVEWLYSKWFTALSLLLFAFMVCIFISHWSEISHDTLHYYNFTRKSVADLLEFWLLFVVLCFLHELGHGLTCKHYGAGVHQMGFQLLYLEPTFFVEVTEGWVYASRWQRVAIIVAGVWVELICCSLASLVYWGTVQGSGAHDLAYKIMLITGVAVVIIEMTPLIKLDGYYLFCELVGIPDLKERSTAYTIASIQRRVFRLPANCESVTPKRAVFFITYALLSGIYSYLLLLAIALFIYHVLLNYIPTWAFIPAWFLMFLMFRSRLRKLAAFSRLVYLDKKDLVRSLLSPARTTALTVIGASILFIPFLHRSIEGRSYLEPVNRAVVRAEVPGEILRVFVEEGHVVSKGAPIANLRNLTLDSQADEALADLGLAEAHTTQAQLQHEGFAQAEHKRQSDAERSLSLAHQLEHLQLLSPVAGVVVTPRLNDRFGTYAPAGSTIAEVADLTQMRARIYVPEYQLQYVRIGSTAFVKLDGRFGSIPGVVTSLAPAATGMEPGLVESDDYEGIRQPHYYVVMVQIPNKEGLLKEGMLADTKIYSGRHSLAALSWRAVEQFLARKIW